MKRIYKIILSLIIIIVLQYSAFSGYKLFLNSMLETKKKTNFSILNYVSSSVKLLNNSDYKIEDIQNTFFENTIYSDFEIVLLDESQMVVIKTDYFENLNFNKLIIEKKRDVFSQKLFDAFFYRNSQKKYLISKNNIKINNENMYLLIISQVETNYSYFINYGLWIMLLILFVSLIIIYSLFSKKKGITAYLNNFEGAITLPILEKHFFIPYLIIDKSNKISKVNNEMIELLQKDKETILSKNIAEIIPKLQDFQKLEKNGNFSDFDFTINEMLLSTKIKVMPFIDKSYQRNSHIIFMLNNSQDKTEKINLQNENDKLRLIYDMNKAIALLSDPKLIITEILKITRKITNFSSSTILIPEKNYLIPYFTNNKEILGMVDSIKIKYGQGLSGTVAKTMKGMIINNAQNSDLATQVDDTEQSYEHLIAIPLTYKNELTGVMLFTRTYEIEFTHEDLSFLEMVGSSTSSILHNSILLQQLSTTEKKYRELISHATIGIFILEENKTIFFNNTFIKLLEIKPEFQIEKPFINLVHDEDKKLYNNALSNFIVDNIFKQIQVRLIKNNGKVLFTEMSFRKIQWDKKTLVMGNIVDISEKVFLNMQLTQSQKFEAMGSLAGGIAHDFKNILTAVIGASEMLLLKSKESYADKYGNIIKASAERGAELAKRLLGYSREHSQGATIFDLNDQINEVINIVKYTMPHSIKFEKNLGNKPLIFEGDPTKIQQCILNLAVNGRDAIGEQGVLTFSSTKITDYSQYQKFKLSNKIDYAVLSVSDTGHGIKESDMKKIFDPFFTTKEVGKGTGIGLATTISIVKDYQGFIDVKSKINFGTTFTIILPLSNKKIEKKEEVIASTVQSKMKLLLVDDEEIILEIVSEMISSLGHQVEIANSGQKALEILKTNQNFDCIFVDRRMPEMDGNELFYQIKEINENIRVIMASGNAEDDEITKLREDGLYEYFTKPYKIADLVKFFQKFNAK